MCLKPRSVAWPVHEFPQKKYILIRLLLLLSFFEQKLIANINDYKFYFLKKTQDSF